MIVVNAEKIRVTGKKLEQKEYFRHSGYQVVLVSLNWAMMLEKQPERVLRWQFVVCFQKINWVHNNTVN